jgi:hypothetical protein
LHVRSTPCPKDVVPLLGPLFGHFRLLHFRRQRSQRGAPARLARSGCVAHSAGAGSQQSTTASTQLWRKRHGGWATQARPAERRRGEESRCRRRGWRELHSAQSTAEGCTSACIAAARGVARQPQPIPSRV